MPVLRVTPSGYAMLSPPGQTLARLAVYPFLHGSDVPS